MKFFYMPHFWWWATNHRSDGGQLFSIKKKLAGLIVMTEASLYSTILKSCLKLNMTVPVTRAPSSMSNIFTQKKKYKVKRKVRYRRGKR